MIEEKFRCHPSIIVEKLMGVITAILLIITTSLDDIRDMLVEDIISYYYLIILGVMGFLLLILIYNIIVWSKTYINIEENTIVIQRNTISSKVNTYGIKNISNVNLEQNIFERILGTYKVKIDTDSLSTANSTDIEIVLSKKDAYEFKNKVLKLMNSNKGEFVCEEDINNPEEFTQEEHVEYDIVYSPKDVLQHCFYNLSIGGIMLNLIVIGFTIFISLQMDDLGEIITLALVTITSCIGLLKLFIGDLFKYYNFSIKRLKDELYISYGMFKKRKYTVPINRINAINIKQPLISRILKRYSADIVTIGVGDDDSEGSQILLSSKKEDFMRKIKILLPELALNEDVALQRQPKKYFIISFVNLMIFTIIFCLTFYLISKIVNEISIIFVLTLGLIVFVLAIVFSYMNYITRGFNLGSENLVISCGIFTKKISIIKYKKIQYMNVKQSPVSSKLNLSRGEIYILASLGNDTKSIGYYDSILFEKLREQIIN